MQLTWCIQEYWEIILLMGIISRISFHSLFKFNAWTVWSWAMHVCQIVTNICTCHNSRAAVASDECGYNRFITIRVTANWSFHRIWILDESLSVKLARGSKLRRPVFAEHVRLLIKSPRHLTKLCVVGIVGGYRVTIDCRSRVFERDYMIAMQHLTQLLGDLV